MVAVYNLICDGLIRLYFCWLLFEVPVAFSFIVSGVCVCAQVTEVGHQELLLEAVELLSALVC